MTRARVAIGCYAAGAAVLVLAWLLPSEHPAPAQPRPPVVEQESGN